MNTDPEAEHFIPSSDAAMLMQRAAAMHVATADLLQVLLLDLSLDKQRTLDALIAMGGRVGIEATVDRESRTCLCMVGFSPDGDRLVLATVTAPILQPSGDARH